MPCRAIAIVALALTLPVLMAAPARAQDDVRDGPPEYALPIERGFYPRLMQGPMLGAVTPTTAHIWLRGSGEFAYAIEIDADPAFPSPRRTPPVRASKAEDYTMTIVVGGLEPGTTYYYRVLAEGEISKYQRQRLPHRLTTAPDGPSRFTVSFGSCARVQSAAGQQPIWGVVERMAPDLFFWLGDNVYADTLDPDILAEEYRRQREVPSYQGVMSTVPQLAVWDDHDYGLNNHDKYSPIREEALTIFERYWANPAYGNANAEGGAEGIFFRYSYGGVDFFFLDNRFHRDPNDKPDGPDKTMLGDAQRHWLLDGLEASEAPFKVIVCGSGFNRAKGPTGDAWSAFVTERDAIFAELFERGVTGVLLFTGDTHVAELNALDLAGEHPNAYTLYELVSSPLAQAPNDGRPALRGNERRLRDPYVIAPNAARVEFDMAKDDPTVTLNVIDSYGELAWEPLVIRASELR